VSSSAGRLGARFSGEAVRERLHVFVGCALGLAVAAALARLTGSAWVFPSLGPTAMLQIERPNSPDSSPRNTAIGHLAALVAGYLSLVVTGLTDAPSTLMGGVSWPRVAAAALSVAVTAVVLLVLDASHAPAGATTLIVSLGLLHQPRQLLVIAGGVVLVTVVSAAYNRATGRGYPVWSVPRQSSTTG
jgi:CBS-domain-containing membrane protein